MLRNQVEQGRAQARNREMEAMLAPAQERLLGRQVQDIVDKSGVCFDPGANELLVDTMGQTVHVALPGFDISQELGMWHHLTLLQYLHTADGSALASDAIGLADMPGGLSRGYGFDKDIQSMFKNDFGHVSAGQFLQACQQLGGTVLDDPADAAAVIWYAPRFPVTVRFYEADDEFPASGKCLVNANAHHYLEIEAAGGACSAVVARLMDILRR